MHLRNRMAWNQGVYRSTDDQKRLNKLNKTRLSGCLVLDWGTESKAMKRLAVTWDGCNRLQHLGNRRVLDDSKSGDVEDLTRGFDSSICQENELMLLKRVQIPMVKSLTSVAKDSMAMGVCILAGKDFVKFILSLQTCSSRFQNITSLHWFCWFCSLSTLFLPAFRPELPWLRQRCRAGGSDRMWLESWLDLVQKVSICTRKGAPNPHLRRILQAKSLELRDEPEQNIQR